MPPRRQHKGGFLPSLSGLASLAMPALQPALAAAMPTFRKIGNDLANQAYEKVTGKKCDCKSSPVKKKKTKKVMEHPHYHKDFYMPSSYASKKKSKNKKRGGGFTDFLDSVGDVAKTAGNAVWQNRDEIGTNVATYGPLLAMLAGGVGSSKDEHDYSAARRKRTAYQAAASVPPTTHSRADIAAVSANVPNLIHNGSGLFGGLGQAFNGIGQAGQALGNGTDRAFNGILGLGVGKKTTRKRTVAKRSRRTRTGKGLYLPGY